MTTARVRVHAIAGGGAGVARQDGLAVFVPRSAPGDLLDVELRTRKRYAEGEIVSVVEASPQRVAPRCEHYDHDQCGGCQLQHLGYEHQRAAKRQMVIDAFARIAKRQVVLDEVVASPREFGYRNKLTLVIRRLAGRTRPVIGMRRRNAPDDVFSVNRCHLAEPRVMAGWDEVKGAAEWLPNEPALEGVVSVTPAGLDFLLRGGASWDDAAEFADRCKSFVSIRWASAEGAAVTVMDRRSGPSAVAGFEQVNRDVAELLRVHVYACVRELAPNTVVDAYAGSGVYAESLVGMGYQVVAIEREEGSAALARERVPTATILEGHVESMLGRALPADVVLLNPPRLGVDERVTRLLSERPPSAIVYVSCDPATLARDVSRLPGFAVASVRAFDMFPQTAHVECVVVLKRVLS